MTPFDEAQDAFLQEPCTETARAYLRQATTSHKKEYIGDATLIKVRRQCKPHLEKPASAKPRAFNKPPRAPGEKPTFDRSAKFEKRTGFPDKKAANAQPGQKPAFARGATSFKRKP